MQSTYSAPVKILLCFVLIVSCIYFFAYPYNDFETGYNMAYAIIVSFFYISGKVVFWFYIDMIAFLVLSVTIWKRGWSADTTVLPALSLMLFAFSLGSICQRSFVEFTGNFTHGDYHHIASERLKIMDKPKQGITGFAEYIVKLPLRYVACSGNESKECTQVRSYHPHAAIKFVITIVGVVFLMTRLSFARKNSEMVDSNTQTM